MSKKEINRVELMALLKEGKLSQARGAERLGVSVRQVRRLLRAYKEEGAAALISKKRGIKSNRCKDALRELSIAFVREHYHDFGPTLAREKLLERHELVVSKESLRKWMTAEQIWVPHKRRRERVQQPRRGRDCFGELIQIDGSEHDWFEGRGARCTLLVFVDDATSKLVHLSFAPSESTHSYFRVLRDHVETFGKPIAYYSDKHAVVRCTSEPVGGPKMTQFGRALDDLNIDIIHANSPAAKGRVERANSTLQDRLVKEMRLEGISDIAAANIFAKEFLASYNRKFGKEAHSSRDAHRPLLPEEILDDICVVRHQRKVGRQLTVRYNNREILLTPNRLSLDAQGKDVDVLERSEDILEVRFRGQILEQREPAREAKRNTGRVVENKELTEVVRQLETKQSEAARVSRASTFFADQAVRHHQSKNQLGAELT